MQMDRVKTNRITSKTLDVILNPLQGHQDILNALIALNSSLR